MRALIAVLAFAAVVPAGGQTHGKAPRTIEGRPDLQGVWTFSTITPLERPAEFAGREFITDAEAQAYEQRIAERTNRDNRESSAEADVSSAYNEFWWDRGVHAARVRGKVRTSLIVDPPDGRLPPLTAEAQARASARAEARQAHPADGPEDRSLGERCLLFNAGPPMLSGPYNNFVQILQTRDHVVIHNEMIHDARVIPMDGRKHLDPAMRRWNGDSVGHWEGDTLVIDTTNFTDKTQFQGSSDQLHVVERIRRVDAAAAGRSARPVGRRHAGRRVDQFQRQDQRPRLRTGAAAHRALHPRRSVDAALRIHGRRSGVVHQTVDRDPADDPQRRAALRVRVPRRQLRDDRDPARRTRRRRGTQRSLRPQRKSLGTEIFAFFAAFAFYWARSSVSRRVSCSVPARIEFGAGPNSSLPFSNLKNRFCSVPT